MPSETVTAARLRQESMWSNQTAASTQALAAFSSSTSRPVAFDDGIANIDVPPLEVGSENQAVRIAVVTAGQADSDAFDLLPLAQPNDALDAPDQLVAWPARVRGRGHRFLRSEAAVHIGQRHRGLNGAQIDPDDDPLLVQPEEGGTAAPRQPAGGAFQDPVLLDELFDNQRDGAALQTRNAGQVGARDGLAGADEVQHDAPVDVPNHLARGGLNTLQINDGAFCSRLILTVRRPDIKVAIPATQLLSGRRRTSPPAIRLPSQREARTRGIERPLRRRHVVVDEQAAVPRPPKAKETCRRPRARRCCGWRRRRRSAAGSPARRAARGLARREVRRDRAPRSPRRRERSRSTSGRFDPIRYPGRAPSTRRGSGSTRPECRAQRPRRPGGRRPAQVEVAARAAGD